MKGFLIKIIPSLADECINKRCLEPKSILGFKINYENTLYEMLFIDDKPSRKYN